MPLPYEMDISNLCEEYNALRATLIAVSEKEFRAVAEYITDPISMPVKIYEFSNYSDRRHLWCCSTYNNRGNKFITHRESWKKRELVCPICHVIHNSYEKDSDGYKIAKFIRKRVVREKTDRYHADRRARALERQQQKELELAQRIAEFEELPRDEQLIRFAKEILNMGAWKFDASFRSEWGFMWGDNPLSRTFKSEGEE